MTVTVMGKNYNPIKRTIKNNAIFLVTDETGNIPSENSSGYGMYMDDTRFLSCLEVKINNLPPVVLSSSTETGHSSVIIATNFNLPNYAENEHSTIPQESIEIKRESIIYGRYFETITISNYNSFDIKLEMELSFNADFYDIFEVRSIEPVSKNPVEKKSNSKSITYNYNDCTGASLSTKINFIEEEPILLDTEKAIFGIELEPNSKKIIKYQIVPRSTASFPEKINAYDFDDAFEKAIKNDKNWGEETTSFNTDNEDFNELLNRSQKDINMLNTNVSYGEYLAAGIPWFSTLFGRDSLITARQTLMLNPNIAKNTLKTLARFQGREVNEWRDEEPGKIPHEIRFGELARNDSVPHSSYYGTADATALWLILFYDYFKWTNDLITINELMPNALECIKWIENKIKEKGYIFYERKSSKGIDNQGWKDSFDSNIHKNGTLAQAPIALVEIQGYAYLALTQMAKLTKILKQNELSINLEKLASDIKSRFHNDFWVDEIDFYALGLDKDYNPMKIITSNPGHCLETGIINEEYCLKIAERFFNKDMFTGWGIRTLSANESHYNPMSYHNGSVWPHDNSLIAKGLAIINKQDLTLKVTSSLFEASRLIRYKRLPELFCGFSRQYKKMDPPVMYPVACSPQAWSAGSIFMLMQSILNMEPNARKSELYISNAQLPIWLNYFKLENLKIGEAYLSLLFKRTSKGLVIDVIDKKGKIDIIIKK